MSAFTLPYQDLAELCRQNISIPNGITHLQPASIDLPIGFKVYQLSSAFIPYPLPLIESLEKNHMIDQETELTGTFIIEPNVHYLFELDVELELLFSHWAVFHTRSTAGRNDLLVSVIGNRQPLFNEVNRGYTGKLWMLVYSHSFHIAVSPGDCLAQMRVQVEYAYEDMPSARRFLSGDPTRYYIRINAKPDSDNVSGWWAAANETPFDWNGFGIPRKNYFHPLLPTDGINGDQLLLFPRAFYILRSLRQFAIPKDQALTIDTYVGGIGEFRSHYAGFVDPGFGLDNPSSLVFEARTPYLLSLTHGQIFAQAQVEYLLRPTEYPYKGVYSGQDIRLAKQFS